MPIRKLAPTDPLDLSKVKYQTIESVIKTTGKGLGFVDLDEYSIRIERQDIGTALNGDMVRIAYIKNSDGIRGKVLEVLSRTKNLYTGTIDVNGGVCTVIADDKRMYTPILINARDAGEAKKGDKVAVSILGSITSWTDSKTMPTGVVTKVFGPKGSNEAEIISIVYDKGFETEYPEAVMEEAKSIEKNSRELFAKTLPHRRDMRSTLTLTIDPIDAKDFDDAISFKEISTDRYEIGIHIADVSYYVRPGSALDAEALKRGCSIYMVDRTIPMLPEVLSNDVCSLNPEEDKLTFSAIFVMDSNGKVHESWFGRTVIRSAKRFTYEEAQESIVSQSGKAPYEKELKTLNGIAKKLCSQKFAKGAIEFETEEIKFILDSYGTPIGVTKKLRLDAHKLVEEYMLLANREVAKFISDSMKKLKVESSGSIYRIHDTPDPEKMLEFSQFVKALGYNLPHTNGKITAQNLNALLKSVEGTSHEALIKTAAIRSMQKAIYSTGNIGHFGLAMEYYTHFTSPIRRYPDLLVHRILENHLSENKFSERDMQILKKAAEQSTEREIAATEAERASKKLKQVEYMSTRIGQTFEGSVSGVSEYGIYVEDSETKSEGMIKVRDIGGDFYEFKERAYCLVGQRTKKKFTLGDKVRFKVVATDLDRKTIDCILV